MLLESTHGSAYSDGDGTGSPQSQQQQQSFLILKNSPSSDKPRMVLDWHGTVWEANPQACDLLSLSLDELLDGGLDKVLTTGDKVDLVKHVRLTSEGVNLDPLETTVSTRGGTQHFRWRFMRVEAETPQSSWVQCELTSLDGTTRNYAEGDGPRRRQARRATDATAEQLAEELAAARAQLEQMEEQLRIRRQTEDRLVARMTEVDKTLATRVQELRRINSDLASIGTLATGALRNEVKKTDAGLRALVNQFGEVLPAEVIVLLEATLAHTRTHYRLLDQMAAFANAGKQTVTRELIDIESIFREVAEALQEEGLNPRCQIHIGTLVPCEGDRTLLRTVAEQLLRNAIQFSMGNKDPVVDVACLEESARRTRKGPRTTTWVVRDNGVGFPKSKIHRLFSPCVVLHARQNLSGAGLGLATVRRAVDRLGGEVWAEGEEGKGASFYFSLPARQL